MQTPDHTHSSFPYLGFGLGLRPEHYREVAEEKPAGIDWFEAISEDFMVEGGRPLYFLKQILQSERSSITGDSGVALCIELILFNCGESS